MNTRQYSRRTVLLGAGAGLMLAGCGLQRGGMSNGVPNSTQVVVHTGPGGGSDVFARQVVKLMHDDRLIDTSWPVRNQTEGSSIGAMSYLRGRKGKTDTIAAVTPTWLVTPLTLSGASVSITALTPIAALLVEPQVVAVRADSGYHTIKDFIADAQRKPDQLVQVGGSITATDSLTGKALQARTDSQWKYLTFSDSAQRIGALLRNDAQMMIGASTDFVDQVKLGAVKVLATVADRKVATFPELTSMKAQGLDTGPLPEEFRGFVGPPEMPEQALTYYQELFGKLVTSPGWDDFVDENGSVTTFLEADKFGSMLKEQDDSLTTLIDSIGLAQQ
ncbi:Bug family tripartite tricarboxylate transporter substrate binding protein [Mycobacterium sp. NPDC003449]